MPRRARQIVVRMATRPAPQAAEAIAELLYLIEQQKLQAGYKSLPADRPAPA